MVFECCCFVWNYWWFCIEEDLYGFGVCWIWWGCMEEEGFIVYLCIWVLVCWVRVVWWEIYVWGGVLWIYFGIMLGVEECEVGEIVFLIIS